MTNVVARAENTAKTKTNWIGEPRWWMVLPWNRDALTTTVRQYLISTECWDTARRDDCKSFFLDEKEWFPEKKNDLRKKRKDADLSSANNPSALRVLRRSTHETCIKDSSPSLSPKLCGLFTNWLRFVRGKWMSLS